MNLSLISDIAQSLLDAVYPPVCCVCGNFFTVPPGPLTGPVISRQTEKSEGRVFAGMMGNHMCPDCVTGFTPLDSPMCSTCGIMFKSRNALDHVCGDCSRRPPFFHSARAAGVYEKSLMTALHQLKYNGRTELADPLGALLLAGFHKWFGRKTVDMIMPVPLHPRKQRQRGFNQAYLLIRGWQRIAEAFPNTFPRDKIARGLLVRTRMTRSQTTLSRRKRQDNVRGAFALKDKTTVKGKSVVLVDDVFTTGATVDECARVLAAAGATRVDVLTVARVR